MSTLRTLSTQRVASATQQFGQQTATQALNSSEEVPDPYAETIRRNQELAEAKLKNLKTLLA